MDDAEVRKHTDDAIEATQLALKLVDALRKLRDDPPVGFGVAGKRQGLTSHLHLAICVRYGAVFFRPAGRGQYNIGIDGGFGDK